MKLAFKIVEYARGRGGIIYTPKIENRNITELDAFFSDPECAARPEIGDLAARLHDMIRRHGFRRDWFKTEKYPTPLGYLRFPATSLRLYCWYHESVIVAGGGCVKTTRRLDETPSCKSAFSRMQGVADRLHERLHVDKELKITHNGFQGSLDFERID